MPMPRMKIPNALQNTKHDTTHTCYCYCMHYHPLHASMLFSRLSTEKTGTATTPYGGNCPSMAVAAPFTHGIATSCQQQCRSVRWQSAKTPLRDKRRDKSYRCTADVMRFISITSAYQPLGMLSFSPSRAIHLSNAGAKASARLMRRGRTKFCTAQKPA